jgi:hypothetical protein
MHDGVSARLGIVAVDWFARGIGVGGIAVGACTAIFTARRQRRVLRPLVICEEIKGPKNDLLLDAALQAATALQQLLQFRGDCATATSASEQEATTARLVNAAAELTKAAETVSGLLELDRMTAASGRTGKTDLN